MDIRVHYQYFDANGMLKASRVAKGNYYIPNRDGKRLLCFALDLGAGLENFWVKGDYKMELSCFDQSVIRLEFSIGDQDVPYNFSEEIAFVNESATRNFKRDQFTAK